MIIGGKAKVNAKMQKRVALHNLGCKVNSYETERMTQDFRRAGYEIVSFTEPADICIVNTCTVTQIADKKSRQMLRRARRANPEAVVVATGCAVETDGAPIPDVDLFVGNLDKGRIVEIVEEYLATGQGREIRRMPRDPVPYAADGCGSALTDKTTTTRGFLKIQDGCDQFCSYCIIPYARGRIRSRDPEDTLREVRALAEQGVQEIVLNGIHLSSYGQEQSPAGAFDAGPLLDLILRCAEIPGLKRIRLGSLEPRLITPDTARAFAHIPALCPHFHLSLQSGCDATLKRMNRHYTSARYAESVAALREAYDRPAITTDVITGFPGETEQEFEETLRFLTDLRLYEIHVFPYSVRPGTVAASLPGQIRRAEKERRSAVLLALTAEQAHTYRESFLGEGLDVLLEEEEEIAGMRYIIGHTERYVRAAVRIGDPAGVPADTDARNTFVRGDAGGFLTDDTILLDAPHEV